MALPMPAPRVRLGYNAKCGCIYAHCQDDKRRSVPQLGSAQRKEIHLLKPSDLL